MNLWTGPQSEHSTSFLKIQEVSSHSLGQDEMFCHIMQWLFIASIWQCFTAYKQNIGKRACMQKFSSRTCANKKPKQKKILLSLRFLHCNHNNYNVQCSITGRLGMAQLRCALRRMDGGLKLLVPEIWGASFLQVHRMTKISHLWPPRFQEGTALMPEK